MILGHVDCFTFCPERKLRCFLFSLVLLLLPPCEFGSFLWHPSQEKLPVSHQEIIIAHEFIAIFVQLAPLLNAKKYDCQISKNLFYFWKTKKWSGVNKRNENKLMKITVHPFRYQQQREKPEWHAWKWGLAEFQTIAVLIQPICAHPGL